MEDDEYLQDQNQERYQDEESEQSDRTVPVSNGLQADKDILHQTQENDSTE